eukprot:189383_1
MSKRRNRRRKKKEIPPAVLLKKRLTVRNGLVGLNQNSNDRHENNRKKMKHGKKSNILEEKSFELTDRNYPINRNEIIRRVFGKCGTIDHELRRKVIFALGNEHEYELQLKQFSGKWYKNNNVNVQNLGVYLTAVMKGYKASVDRNLDHGYVKFGCYARTFCESICIYLLKKNDDSLFAKIDKLKTKKNFPSVEMDYIRDKTNKV